LNAQTGMSKLRRGRIASQILFFTLFLFLLSRTEYHGRDIIAYPVRIFLEIDPLIFLTTWISSRILVPALLWSLIVLVPTMILGRFFCGWVCPLGALNDGVGSLARSRMEKPGGWEEKARKLKYYLLLAILAAAALGLHLVGFLDPLSLLIRSFALAVSPAANYLFHGAFATLSRMPWTPFTDALEGLYSFLRQNVFAFSAPVFRQATALAAILSAVLLLNLVRKRFWCRFLCPLGALLGLFSRFALLNHRVSPEDCDQCNLCLVTCNGGARPAPAGSWKGSECVLCFNCRNSCDRHALAMTFGRPRPELRRTDLQRRYVLGSALGGVAALAILRSSPRRKTGYGLLIRPPGSREEEEFLRRCVKCGECMKVCITNGLQPTFLQAGLEGMWSPVLVPRIGYCEYNCTLCGQVCPTGAIERLPVEVKRKRKIGLAFIDRSRCLPYAFATSCIVCEEHCPTSPKAIRFRRDTVETPAGPREMKLPYVDPEVCTGCGICEYKCPVGEQAAIRVFSVGEERSPSGQLFLG